MPKKKQISFELEVEYHTFPSFLFKLNLTGAEFKAYCLFKMIQEKSGLGFIEKDYIFLCKQIGCTKEILRKIKRNLQKKRIELGGDSLISITKRRRGTIDIIVVNTIDSFMEYDFNSLIMNEND
jgi:hypothetical protein